MKKWLILLIFTAVCSGVLVAAGRASRPQTVVLEVRTLQASTVEQTVRCDGRVEKSESAIVTVPTACVVREVLVTDGETVQKGDTLFTIDREKTLAVLAKTDGALAVHTALRSETPVSVTAPAAGIVRDFSLLPGDITDTNSVCATIAAVSPVQIRLSIPERSIRQVSVGQKAAISGVGFQKSAYPGEIIAVSGTAKQETGLSGNETIVEAVVALPAGVADNSLRVGLTAKASITVSMTENGFVLPYDAVAAKEDGKEYVCIFQNGGVEKRVISPLAETPDGYLVTTGFQNGDQLVLNPSAVRDHAVYTVEEIEDD